MQVKQKAVEEIPDCFFVIESKLVITSKQPDKSNDNV